MKQRLIKRIPSLVFLVLMMSAIGLVTTVAAVNTMEVIFWKDTSYSNVISNITITKDAVYNESLKTKYNVKFNPGIFGSPMKIKLPEANLHYDIKTATLENGNWKATKGTAHSFIVSDPVQKTFGSAVIYMRYNTATTQHIGETLSGDIINIVTTDGWQLGYVVEATSSDPSSLPIPRSDVSSVILILVDERTGEIKSILATLEKVGEKL